MCYAENHDANLVIDGCLSIQNQMAQILPVIEKYERGLGLS